MRPILTERTDGSRSTKSRSSTTTPRRATIQSDLDARRRAAEDDATDEDRERAAVYMDGLSQMRSEWGGVSAQQPVMRDARRAWQAGRRDDL